MQLFGTDGVRGEIIFDVKSDELAIEKLLNHRQICPRLFRLIGEALGATINGGDRVVIGWDGRQGNEGLVANLTVGLHLRGIEVIHAGEVATPGLNASMLNNNAHRGCMITASHNKHTDSGIKIFDQSGFKSMPEYEEQISSIIFQLASEEREVDDPDFLLLSKPDIVVDGIEEHYLLLEERLKVFQKMFEGRDINHFSPEKTGFILDSSGGPGQNTNVNWLNAQGIKCSATVNPEVINLECGAGLYSPGDYWTWEEIISSNNNILFNTISKLFTLQELNEMRNGTILAAALDGDGDRCLILEVSETLGGLVIVDGDQIAATIIKSSKIGANEKWNLATSIEADLGLNNMLNGTNIHITGVGDRWLSKCLRNVVEGNIGSVISTKMPKLIGCEDSGHIVMPAPIPNSNGNWSLVGDGVATLFAYLTAKSTQSDRGERGVDSILRRGWKTRVSIRPSDRKLWDGKNQLAKRVEDIARMKMNEWGITDWAVKEIEGENSLLFIQAKLKDENLYLGIRNSGTEAKTNITLRLPPSLNGYSQRAEKLTNMLYSELENTLKPKNGEDYSI